MSASIIIGHKRNGTFTLDINPSMLYPVVILVGNAQQYLTKWHGRRCPDAWTLLVVTADLQDDRLAPSELHIPDDDLIARLVTPDLHRYG